MIRRFPKTFFSFVGVLLAVLSLLVGEVLVRALKKPAPKPYIEIGNAYREGFGKDPEVGWIARPGSRTSMKWTTLSGEVLFDAIYTVEDNGARHSFYDPKKAKEYLLIMGGSIPFGEGVDDDETFASVMAHKAPQYRPYNYSVIGHGPGEVLMRLRRWRQDGSRAGITEKTGRFVYPIYDDYLHRILNGMVGSVLDEHRRVFELTESGELRNRGPFKEALPVRAAVYRFLSGSELFRFCKFRWPLFFREADYDFLMRFFTETRELHRQIFGNDNFDLVLIPSRSNLFKKHLLPKLKAAGFSVIDLSSVSWSKQHIIPMNWHPTPLAHQQMAEQILARIPQRPQ